MKTTFNRFLFHSTPFIKPANYRTYVSFNIGTVSAMGVHILIPPLFWFLGATELLWLNILSHPDCAGKELTIG